jgi:4-hydroxy-3-methylbut-2-enyl diphosphate reductase
VVFSAHGVAKAVPTAAKARNMFVLDATCPLVSKVHIEAARHHEEGLEIVLIGHAGHPEVVGTMGQLAEGAVRLVETVAQAREFTPRNPAKLAFVTQTTLSVDDTAEIVSVLKERFPQIVGPHKEDICYATTNRQAAVKAIAPRIACLLVVGSPQSSNSLRLVEVAARAGCPRAMLIEGARDIPWAAMEGLASVGVTAGASAPEKLVEEVIGAFKERFEVALEVVTTATEHIAFNVPRELRAAPVG